MTKGVLYRVDSLADREEGFIPSSAVPFKHLIPLKEIIAEIIGQGKKTKKVEYLYQEIIRKGESEFKVLLDLPFDELKKITLPEIAQGVIDMREGKVKVIPGYDGLYGKILFEKEKTKKVVNEYPGYKYSLVHQIDLVGPRFIKNYGRFYCLNIIDIESHCAQVNPIKSKATEYIVNSVIRFWQTFGIPDFIQMDNELSFRGSNRHPHSFGQLIRFALSQGVTPIFIPQAEPWRNGIIEKFNDTFDKKFFRAQSYKDLADVRNKAIEFENFHNNYYRYKANNNKVPIEVFNSDRPDIFLDIDYTLPKFIPLIDGDIILIRLIRSDRKLNIFGESFLVSKYLVYSYIEALISVKEQSLKVFRDNQLLEEFEYIMPVDWL